MSIAASVTKNVRSCNQDFDCSEDLASSLAIVLLTVVMNYGSLA
jgi:hypothetical protein